MTNGNGNKHVMINELKLGDLHCPSVGDNTVGD